MPWLFEGSNVHDPLTAAGIAAAIGILALFVAINALGAAFFARANTLITWVKLGIPLLVGGAILASRFEPENFARTGGFAPMGMQGVFAAVSTGGVVFALIGFRHAIDMAGETKRPRVTIPLALTLSIVIAVVLYSLIQVAFVGALEPRTLQGGWLSSWRR